MPAASFKVARPLSGTARPWPDSCPDERFAGRRRGLASGLALAVRPAGLAAVTIRDRDAPGARQEDRCAAAR